MTAPQWDRPAPFILPVTPRAADIDGLDHTNNAVYVRWCEEAGWAHSNALGLTLADYKRLDRGMAIRRSEFNYIFATNEGEDLLLGTWLLPGDSPLSMQRCFQLVRQRDNTTVLRARWDLVCIELSSGRPKRLPPEFSEVYVPAFSQVSASK
ncbi:acyl-CoA thioesterase [Pseudoduganella sp. R-32]|uniref:acyl-CoA thioesterase n=1 Tax=Pseudoduganella sp. R-32 TaxID=3404061 RepID=UPI003CF918AC